MKPYFFLYLLSVYYAPSIGRALGLGDTNVRPDVFLMFVAFVTLIFVPGNLPVAHRIEWVAVWLGLYWLSSLITALVSMAFLGGQLSAILAPITGILKPLMIYTIFFFWVRQSSAVQRLKLIYWGLLLATPLMLIAIAQFLDVSGIRDISNRYYGKIGHRGTTDVLAMLFGGRVCSTFDGEPNQFGTFCAIVLACCMVAALYVRRKAALQGGLLLVFGLTLIGLLLSWSRGAMGGLVAGVLLVMMLTSPLRWIKIALAIILFVVTVGPLMPLTATMRVIQLVTLRNQQGAPIYSEREALWHANVEIWKRDPLFGVMGVPKPAPDNLAIGLGSLTGISGLLLMSAALVAAFWKGLSQFVTWSRATSRWNEPEIRARCALSLMVSVSTLVIVVNGAATPTVLEPRVLEPYWALMAIGLAPLACIGKRQVEGAAHA
jgi:O-antigen ligase